MRPEEFRIGNWVSDLGGTQWTVSQVGRSMCEIETSDCKKSVFIDEGQIQPIPLNEQWLERFGLEKSRIQKNVGPIDISADHWSTEGIDIYDHENGEYSLYGFNSSKVVFEHVHQLQNLYYALTGKELELKR